MRDKLYRFLMVLSIGACGYAVFDILFPTPPDLSGLKQFIQTRQLGEKIEVRYFQRNPVRVNSLLLVQTELRKSVLDCLDGELKKFSGRIGYRAMQLRFDNDSEYALSVYRGRKNRFHVERQRYFKDSGKFSEYPNETVIIECDALMPLWNEVEEKAKQNGLIESD